MPESPELFPPEFEQVPHYVAVGVPLGFFVDPDSGERGSFLSFEGEIVGNLSVEEYALWLSFFHPQQKTRSLEVGRELYDRDVGSELAKGVANGYLMEFTPYTELNETTERLRPIPRGVGMGNLNDPLLFEITNQTGNLAMIFNALGIAVWNNLNGMRSLRSAISLAADQSGQSPGVLEVAATELVCVGMAAGMLFLDRLDPSQV